MITTDGYLVGEKDIKKRAHTMYLVAYCLASPGLRPIWGNFFQTWSRFIWVASQYIFIGRYRCLQGDELKQWNEAFPTEKEDTCAT
jgi:hypothetical protein